MFSGPMFRWEYHAATRNRRPFLVRTCIAAVLGGVAMVAALVAAMADSIRDEPASLLTMGRAMFVGTIVGELLVLLFLVPAHVAGAIAEERERDTLPSLLLTRLRPIEIVLTKVTARWLSTLNLVLVGVPLLVASAWAAGLEAEMVLAVLGLASTSAFMAVLAILASSFRDRAGTARAQASGWNFAWLLAPPLIAIMPVGSGTLWGMLLSELKSLCRLLAPSSPLSLVTDSRWYTGAGAGGPTLESRLALMAGLQALFGVLALGLATSKVKARETNPNWIDPTRGYRPPVGDDPLFWREYELPFRRGSGSIIVLRLRYVVILIKAMLLNLLALAGILLALAIPLGTLAATLYFGYDAFRELWQQGYNGPGPFVKRHHFHLLVRVTTCLLALLPMLNMNHLASQRIVGERDRKTWDVLLTTPLSGAEILGSKTWATVYAFRHSILPFLPVIWAMGLILGVATPLGVVLAAVDLVLVAWALQAMGLHSVLRPNANRPAQSLLALFTLVVGAAHIGMLAAALASPRELARFATWDATARWSLVLAVLLVPTLTGLAAWIFTRRMLDRFEEWVGRPTRKRPGRTKTKGAAAGEAPRVPPPTEPAAQ